MNKDIKIFDNGKLKFKINDSIYHIDEKETLGLIINIDENGYYIQWEGEDKSVHILFENEEFDESALFKELKSKSEENSLQNYLNQEEKWEVFTNYIIVINSKLNNDLKFQELLHSFFSSIKTTKKLEVILYNQIISESYQISKLFE